MSETRRVRIGDIARGIVRGVPDALTVNRGLLGLATLRPDSRRSIGRVLEDCARRTPDAPALQFEGRRWSYTEFNDWANRCADVFARLGVGAGDTVAILMENRPEVLACAAGAVKLGAVAGLLNHQQRGEVLAHSLGLVEPRVLVVSAECQAALASSGHGPGGDRGCEFLWHGGDQDAPAPEGWHELAHELADADPSNPESTGRVRADAPCFYIFTSGTTGLPKASVMTHYRWLASMTGVGAATLRLKPEDVFYVCLPLYHNNALTVSWGAALSAGACLALDRKFSASRFWDRVREHRATAFCYIGELLRYLLNQPAAADDRDHPVRLIVGNGLRPELWQAFERRFGIERIYEFYGASESNIAFVNAFGLSRTAGFSPMPFAIVEFDHEAEQPVRDHKGRLKKVGRGGTGLLISEVSKRRPFDGYTDPAAGEAKLIRDAFKRGDCWFNTGDLVRDQGLRHIQFVDRLGDTFRWKGENVATGEVEGVLAGQPGIADAAVYGVEVPHADGRAGMAALTLADGAELDGAALAVALRAALPAYAVPLFLRIRAEQDTTGTFKYRKVELKREGFDPARIDEPLYRLTDSGYTPLDAEAHAAIVAGEIRA